MTLQQVHIRVTDAATGQPTPVRLRVTDADGRYHAPLGRLTRFAIAPNQDVGGNVIVDGEPWSYIDGACEINLPAGPLRFQIAKGLEYRPTQTDVQLVPGKLALRFPVERWTDVRQHGWHSGDARAHFVPPHAALLEAAAEDLAVVNLLIREIPATQESGCGATPLLDAFSGQAPCLERAGHLIAVNTENHHPVLGSVGLLDCHRVVYPLSFGGPLGQEDWTLADWCGQCHRKRGLTVWTRIEHQTPDLRFGEPLALAILGHVDAIEISPTSWDGLPAWYGLLNLGLRLPLVGASGKESNATLLGAVRTYVQTGAAACSYAQWIDGIRAGRSFVTCGPLLALTVNGETLGNTVPLANAAPVRVAARAWGSCDTLQILLNGIVAASSTGGADADIAVEEDVAVERSCWLAARCLRGGAVVAHTSPVYVTLAGQAAPVDPAAVLDYSNALERLIAWCETEARCPSAAHRARLIAAPRQAMELLRRAAASGQSVGAIHV